MAKPTLELGTLLEAARSGDPAAVNALFEAVRPCLRGWAAELLSPDVQAKVASSDLVQESLAEAHAALPQFQGRTTAEFLAWLRSIQQRNALTAHTRYLRQKRDVGREVSLEAVPPPAAGQTPSAEAIANEQADQVQRVFRRLPPDMQQVLELRHFQERPYPEVAQQMGRTEAAVRKLYARALLRWKREVDGT